MKLSRQGYGDIVTVKSLDVKTFIDLIHYENYIAEYDKVTRELNKRK